MTNLKVEDLERATTVADADAQRVSGGMATVAYGPYGPVRPWCGTWQIPIFPPKRTSRILEFRF